MSAWFVKASWVASLCLLVALVFAIYSWIDARVSLEYARQEQQRQRDQTNLLLSLLQETSSVLNRTEVRRLIMEKFQDRYLVKEEQERILVCNLAFRFDGESLAEVLLLDEEK